MAIAIEFECAKGHRKKDYYKFQQHLAERGCGVKKANEHTKADKTKR